MSKKAVDKKSKSDSKGLQKKCDEYLSGWQRAQADYQNLVKESAQRQSEFVKFANQGFILELLPILDNFKIAFEQIPDDEKDSAWVVGFGHIKKQLEDLLKRKGVEEIKTKGKKFDPELHEAVAHEKTASHKSGQIIKQVKPGYKLNNKIIQAAKVVVAK